MFATDRDPGLNGQIVFSIVVNSEDLFTVNSVSGVISANQILDREIAQLRVIEVSATDLGQPPKTDFALVYIHVDG